MAGRRRDRRPPDGPLARLVVNPWFLLSTAGVAVLSFVAALTGPVPELAKQRTEIANFAATPVNRPTVTRFLLRVDAPLEHMPHSGVGFCDERMIDWLRRHGTEVPPYQRIAVRNTAEDGAMLSLSNVRAVDVRRTDPVPVIVFDCPDGGNGDNAILHLRLDRSGPAQRHDEEHNTLSPFTFNLEPGEQGSLEIHLLGDEAHSYTGHLVVDVTTGGRTETRPLPLNGRPDGFDRLSPGRWGRLVVSQTEVPGEFSCDTPNPDRPEDITLVRCSADEIRARIAAITSAPG